MASSLCLLGGVASRPFAIPAFQLRLPTLWRIPIPLLTLPALANPLLDRLPSPSSLLQDIWDGILRAVPKKKTTYSRTRSRQLAGKALKDLHNIVKCPSCGKPKRAHFLCAYCVHGKFCFLFPGQRYLCSHILATQMYWKQLARGARMYISKSAPEPADKPRSMSAKTKMEAIGNAEQSAERLSGSRDTGQSTKSS
jgi:large subunit ribosomal protein L32